MDKCPAIVAQDNANIGRDNTAFNEQVKCQMAVEKEEAERLKESRKIKLDKKVDKARILSVLLPEVGRRLLTKEQIEFSRDCKKGNAGFVSAAELSLQLQWYAMQIQDKYKEKIKISGNKNQLTDLLIGCVERLQHEEPPIK